MALERTGRPLGSFADDARAAIVSNPDYFVWWYTVKSVGLGVVCALFAYHLGKTRRR